MAYNRNKNHSIKASILILKSNGCQSFNATVTRLENKKYPPLTSLAKKHNEGLITSLIFFCPNN